MSKRMTVDLTAFTLCKLHIMALKAFPSSPYQMRIQAEIQKRHERGETVWTPPVESFKPDADIVEALKPKATPKPLEGQTHLFSERTEPAKRKRGESSDQQTLF